MSLIIKGKRAIFEALRAGKSVERIVVNFQQMTGLEDILSEARIHRIKVHKVAPKVFAKSYPEAQTQGIVAVLAATSYLALQDVLAAPTLPPVIMALDHLEDPYNFGAILRSCEVFGIKTVLFAKDRAATLTPGVVKVSSGAVHYLDLVKISNLGDSLLKLKNAGYWIYGADSNQGQNLNEVSFNLPMVMVMGNEEKGISKRISKMVDLSVKIPTVGSVDSLNVSVAAGIMAYHIHQFVAQ